MELHMPGWIASPLLLKSHMTAPHAIAAKMENWRASGSTGRAGTPGKGAGVLARADVRSRERIVATTRDTTYKTI